MSRVDSLFILFVCAVLASPAGAQVHSIYGSIVGTVTDQSGAVIPGVAVTATNVETNIASSTKTDDQGRYRIERLIAGAYRVRAEQATFKTFVRDGITLSEAATVRVNVALEVGQVTERIEVVEHTPLIETESPQLSSTMTWAERKFLPTRDVSFYSTLGLYPGWAPTARYQSGVRLSAV